MNNKRVASACFRAAQCVVDQETSSRTALLSTLLTTIRPAGHLSWPPSDRSIVGTLQGHFVDRVMKQRSLSNHPYRRTAAATVQATTSAHTVRGHSWPLRSFNLSSTAFQAASRLLRHNVWERALTRIRKQRWRLQSMNMECGLEIGGRYPTARSDSLSVGSFAFVEGILLVHI